MYRITQSLLLNIAAIVLVAPSQAALLNVNIPNCYDYDSSTCDDSQFLAAVGGGPLDVLLNFDVDSNGTPIPDVNQDVPGTLFSDDVTFSSRSSLFGGIDSSLVNYGPMGVQIGPASGFDGILNIDFTDPVAAVGFLTAGLEPSESITVYDAHDSVIGTFPGVSGSSYDYFGLIACEQDLIGRIELDGRFYAIQTIQFNTVEVPEPATGASLLAAFAILILKRMNSCRNAVHSK